MIPYFLMNQCRALYMPLLFHGGSQVSLGSLQCFAGRLIVILAAMKMKKMFLLSL